MSIHRSRHGGKCSYGWTLLLLSSCPSSASTLPWFSLRIPPILCYTQHNPILSAVLDKNKTCSPSTGPNWALTLICGTALLTRKKKHVGSAYNVRSIIPVQQLRSIVRCPFRFETFSLPLPVTGQQPASLFGPSASPACHPGNLLSSFFHSPFSTFSHLVRRAPRRSLFFFFFPPRLHAPLYHWAGNPV